MGPLKHVVITVIDGQVAVVPPRVVVSRKAQEEVCVHSPQGEASIQFYSTPSESDTFLVPKGGSVAFGRAIGPNGIYKGAIIVRIPGDRREGKSTLEVEVVD